MCVRVCGVVLPANVCRFHCDTGQYFLLGVTKQFTAHLRFTTTTRFDVFRPSREAHLINISYNIEIRRFLQNPAVIDCLDWFGLDWRVYFEYESKSKKNIF